MERVAQYNKKDSRQQNMVYGLWSMVYSLPSIISHKLSIIFCRELSTITYQPSCNKGFSLIEMMIALFILTVAVLGLLDLTITSIKTNMQNDIRNTAVRLTSQTAEVLLARPFSTTTTCGITLDPTITTGNSPFNAQYTYNNLNICLQDSNPATDFQKYPFPQQQITGNATISGQIYNITWTVTVPKDINNQPVPDLLQISIYVSYNYRGQVYTNNAVIYKHQ